MPALGANGGHISLLLSLLGKKSCNLLCVPRLLQQFPELPRNSSAECVLTSSRAFVILFSNRSPPPPALCCKKERGAKFMPSSLSKKSRLGWGAVLEGEGGKKQRLRSFAGIFGKRPFSREFNALLFSHGCGGGGSDDDDRTEGGIFRIFEDLPSSPLFLLLRTFGWC